MDKQIVVFSHGFGVRQDDRGLFTDIAAGIPGVQCILFDYNEVDEANNTITVASLDTQAKKLRQVVAATIDANPGATVDLVCHSQGCVVAALASPPGVRKIIFTAPPAKVLATEAKIKEICAQYDLAFTKKDTIRIPRKDGSTTIIPPDYWRVRDGLDAQKLYNALLEKSALTIITATKDEVLGKVKFDTLSSKIKIIKVAAGHNFEQPTRQALIVYIADELGAV